MGPGHKYCVPAKELLVQADRFSQSGGRMHFMYTSSCAYSPPVDVRYQEPFYAHLPISFIRGSVKICRSSLS